MFELFSHKKSLIESDLLSGFVDFHSHILPGVDDGVKSIKDALVILDEYEKLGVKKVVLTPHIMEIYGENNVPFLKSEFAKFTSQYTGNIELSLAAEYMLDSKFDSHLSSGKMLTLWDDYLLVETSYVSAPINFKESLQRIKSNGYFVVLAHPERYNYMKNSDFHDLREREILFQLNLLSLSGYYGKQAKDKALYLLENNMYNIIGSDIHNLPHFKKWIGEIKLRPKHLKILREITHM